MRRHVLLPRSIIVSAMLLTSCAGDPRVSTNARSTTEIASTVDDEKRSPPGNGPGRISGTVILFGAEDHQAILVSASGWQESSDATTTASGHFEAVGLAEGYNVLTFQKDGFASVTRGIMVTRDRETSLSETTLFRVGSIIGRVLHADGRPAKHAIVLLCQSSPPPGHPGVVKFVTDEQGRYQIRGANPGMHQITAFMLEEKLGGEGVESGGFGVTVAVNPGERTTAESMVLRPDETARSGLGRSGCGG